MNVLNRKPVKCSSLPGPMMRTLLAIGGAAIALSGGCSSLFNQSFINLIAEPVPDASGVVPNITIDNAPGHVVVVFINNTRFDQRLINYLSSIGVDTSDENLRPRVRVRTDIRYANGNTATLEFIDGSDIIQASVVTGEGTQTNPNPPRDLTENDLTNVVAICDVSIVQPGGGIDSGETSVEVFVPAFQKVITVTESDVVGGGVTIVLRELESTIPPQFVPLQPDDVDANNNVTVSRNLDIRDVPVPATNLLCGTVVGFTLSGTLELPFVQDELGAFVPGYLDTDATAEAAVPGRFDFTTTVR